MKLKPFPDEGAFELEQQKSSYFHFATSGGGLLTAQLATLGLFSAVMNLPPDPVIVSTQASYLHKYSQDTEITEK